ncbi:MAG: hypothetical protein AAF196_07310 [Planctomycetota bacterium]
MADAKVRWLPFGSGGFGSGDPVERIRVLENRGKSASSGIDGRVVIPYRGNRLRVYATAPGGLIGTDVLASSFSRTPSSEEPLIRVYPEVTARLLVVGPEGRPVPRAGVAFYTGNRFATVRLRADDEGRLTVPIRGYGITGADTRIQAVAWGGGGPVVPFSIRSLADSSEDNPEKLELPAWGGIEVRVREADARATGVADLSALEPSLLAEGNTDRDGFRVYPPRSGEFERYREQGIATCAPVLLGRSFRVLAGFGDLETIVEGPDQQGEVVSVGLQFDGAEDRFLAVRLLRTDQSPVRNQPVTLKLRDQRGYAAQSWYRARTDESGFVVVRRTKQGREPRDLRIAAKLDGVPHVGVLPVRDLPESGRRDLGDCVIEPLPLLVAGVVVDTADRAVLDRIELKAECRKPDEEDADAFDIFGGQSSEWQSIDTELRWFGDGRFELYSEDRCERAMRLMARRPLVAVDDTGIGVPFTMAQRDVRVVVGFGGEVQFDFLAEDPQLLELVSAQLCCVVDGEPEAGGPPSTADNQGGADGAPFVTRWDGLPPGDYVVRLYGSEYDALFTTDAFTVGPGGLTDGVPDTPVDLGSRLRVLGVNLKGADGQAIGSAQVRTRRSGSDTPWVLESAGLDGLTTSSALELRVDVQGYEPTIIANLSEDRTLFLKPLTPIQFRADSWPEARGDLDTLSLSITAPLPRTRVGAFHFRTFFVQSDLGPRNDLSEFRATLELPRRSLSEIVLVPGSAQLWRIRASGDATGPNDAADLDVTIPSLPPDGIIRLTF